MRLCIICREKKKDKKGNSEFNKEHVFPESLGGRYVIKSVCKVCNKKLGDMIDNPLLNHDFISVFRNEFRLSKGNRQVPPPYRNFNKRNLNFTIIKDGNRYRTRLKRSNSIEIDKENKRVKITTDDLGYPEYDIEQLKLKYAKEFDVLPKEIRVRVEKDKNGGSFRRIPINAPNKPIILGAAKIGYELACEKLEGYLDDQLGKQYAMMFHRGKCDDSFINQNIYLGLSKEVTINENTLKIMQNSHFVILHFCPEVGVVATINFFRPIPPLYQSLIISRNFKKYENLNPIILINDYQNKKVFFV